MRRLRTVVGAALCLGTLVALVVLMVREADPATVALTGTVGLVIGLRVADVDGDVQRLWLGMWLDPLPRQGYQPCERCRRCQHEHR